MFYEILDEERKKFLSSFSFFKDGFYLAGGTGLALQLGHRRSVDFDFFVEGHFDTEKHFRLLSDIMGGYALRIIQEEKDTLSVLVDDRIKVSFFGYPYPLVQPLIEEEYLRVASFQDIGCMKLAAIVSRATNKDYVDLYFILQSISLRDLLVLAEEKMPELDENVILKSLVYFDDVTKEPLQFMEGRAISFPEAEEYLREAVRRYMKERT